MKVLEENKGRKISDNPHSNIFTDMSPRARDRKERINKWDLIKLKSFCMAKENSIKIQKIVSLLPRPYLTYQQPLTVLIPFSSSKYFTLLPGYYKYPLDFPLPD